MSRPPVAPLSIGALARELTARQGMSVDALRCYETLVALWVRCADLALPAEADRLRTLSLAAAKRLVAGETQVAAPDSACIPGSLRRDESVVRLPAAVAVQGVEWPDMVQLAETWLSTCSGRGPVTVVGVRTGGAYLAPLVAARLAHARLDVRLTSHRPGEPLLSPGPRTVLLVDDPPLTGRTLLKLARRFTAPGSTEVLVPVFHEQDVQPLRDAGVPVTVLPRERWASTRRLGPESLTAYLDAQTSWTLPAEGPVRPAGFQPGRENSALAPWPGLRHRSPARTAFALTSSAGRQQVVASWVPPGIFGDTARATAAGLTSPFVPATVGIAPGMVLTEELPVGTPLTTSTDFWLDDAVAYVLDRAAQLPLDARLRAVAPVPAVLYEIAAALTTDDPAPIVSRLHGWSLSLGSSVPDGRCEAEKWVISDGRLRKTGHLAHTYRRDNELLSPLIDLAAVATAFGADLKTVATVVDRHQHRTPGCLPALATALLCYGTARAEQLPRTYNPQRAAATATEAYRLQSTMSDAVLLLQETLRIPVSARPPVLRRWAQPPGVLLRPLLPIRGRPAPTAPPIDPAAVTEAVIVWTENRPFEAVPVDGALLLAPSGPAATWPHAAAELGNLAVQLPHPSLLAWCGAPLVQLRQEESAC
ncbi:phosphoribosyltransferase family protein [Streptomyces sp. NPDC054835]|uniref:phosphoribosyltransferase family protein n=1 Tax=Streptomyces exfoliatus TaxID=1905 RepID=UPI00046307B6|nr:phosphoribosyltransferase family protein [Streptomyces exfoliatus]